MGSPVSPSLACAPIRIRLVVLLALAGCGSSGGGFRPPLGGPDAGVTPQARVCDRFITCTAEVAPDQSAGAVAAYGVDGACWKSADKATCERGCRIALEGLHQQFPAAAGCALCSSSADCSGERPACSAARGECVACTGDEHCRGGAAHCEAQSTACVACTSDDHCAAPAPAFRAPTHQCVECTAARHCGAGRTCVDNACCTLDRCPVGGCGLLPDGSGKLLGRVFVIDYFG